MAFMVAMPLVFVSCTDVATEKDSAAGSGGQVRFASFNTSLFRPGSGDLRAELSADTSAQARHVAEIIQRVRPDVIALLEFDYDEGQEALRLFRENYLQQGWNGAEPVEYPYAIAFPSNTGEPSGLDLNKDGDTGGPDDAFGYGAHQGQYAFALLSKYPFRENQVRTFRFFLWEALPMARFPYDSASNAPWYSPRARQTLRISSKNHVDVPLVIGEELVHALIMHPTPPVFDGPEDRNGLRNFDEIRLFADYIGGSDYLVDDQGRKGGLADTASFVLMGDFNADPLDGDSAPGAIAQLLRHSRVNQKVATGELIPASEGSAENTAGRERLQGHRGSPLHDTSVYGLRIDYVLPSGNLKAVDSGVFWPVASDSLRYLVKEGASSDHFLVWVDVVIGDQSSVVGDR